MISSMQKPLEAVVPYGPAGSSSRVRALNWLNHTGIQAILHDYLGLPANYPKDVMSQPFRALSAERDLRKLSRNVQDSTLFLVREASPFSRGRIEQVLLSSAQYSVYDFDDALGTPERGLVAQTFSKAMKWRRCVRSADTVVAGNAQLAEQAHAAGARNIKVIPSCVEPSLYRQRTSFEREGPPTAVWIGSPATEGYLKKIAAPLLFANRETGLRLNVISSGNASFGELDRIVDREQWTSEANNRLADFDFGIMPLPDDLWTRGKCAYKLLEYGAAGLPMVGSPVGANVPALAVMGGLSATTSGEWVESLIALSTAESKELNSAGMLARQGVVDKYSYSSWAQKWLEAIQVK